LEYTAILFLVHCLYGFSFSFLGIQSRQYHAAAGVFHILVLVFMWSTDYIVADTFIERDFIGLEAPYVEPALGPLGPFFVGYTALSALIAMVIWIRRKQADVPHRNTYIAGMIVWILLGIHDGLASLGVPAFQYLMEYGFFGFATAVLWGVFKRYLDVAEEEQYRVITEFAHDCILVIQDEEIVFWNQACCDLIGRPLTDSAPRGFLDIMVSADRDRILEDYKTLLKGERVTKPHTVRLLGEAGEQRFVEIVSSLIEYRNRPAVLAVMRDLTERKREEEARQENERKLAGLRKMESLGLLAGGVAHDLNNVLSGIATYPELILMELPEDSKLRKPIETMQQAGQRAAAIVEDLLTMARGVAVTKEPLKVNSIIKEYLSSPEYDKLVRFHPTVAVKTYLDESLFTVWGSRIHIRKVIMNMVSNASEAIEGSGNVTVRTSNRYVDKLIEDHDHVIEGEYVVLTVADDGSGIPSHDLERIFEPFYTKKVMGRSGTGLGLALVWNVMNDHEGFIDVKSDETGTTFELYFPASRDVPTYSKKKIPLEELSGNGERILVVDDVESQREIVSGMLEKLGYRPKCVSSGQEAVEYLKEHTADLVLLDMIMDPGMNGRMTYEKIIEIRPGQKAVIVSGYAETDDVRETQRMGAGEYIKKPYTIETVGLAVKKELGRGSALDK
jgi:PAS domain S-box-containing protein